MPSCCGSHCGSTPELRNFFGDHLSGGILVDAPHRHQDRAGDVAVVVLVLLPHIQDDDFLGVHHLFGIFLGDLLVSICGVSAAPSQQQKR